MSTAPVVLQSRGSFRTEVAAGTHRWVLDEPVDAGGSGVGPTPYDMLAAALGGCTAMTLQYYARRQGIPLTGVDVTVSHDRQHAKDCVDCMTTTGYIHRFTVEIRLHGELSSDQREEMLKIAKKCPVAKTLTNEIKIEEVLA